MSADRDHIVRRMREYFERAVAQLEHERAWLEGFQNGAAEEDLPALVEQQKRHMAETKTLAEEYRLLRREWDETSVPDEQAAAVRALARRAEKLANELQAFNQRADDVVRKRMGEVQATQGDLRRGQAALRGYRSEAGPDRMDRQA